MKILKANKKDFSELKRLFLESQKYDTHFDEDLIVNKQTEEELGRSIKEIFRDPNRVTFIAKEGEKLLGYVVAMFPSGVSKSGWIGEIFVTELMRGKGVGFKLIERAFGWLRRRGVKDVKLWCLKKNKKTLTFYKNLKFKKEPEKGFILGRRV